LFEFFEEAVTSFFQDLQVVQLAFISIYNNFNLHDQSHRHTEATKIWLSYISNNSKHPFTKAFKNNFLEQS